MALAEAPILDEARLEWCVRRLADALMPGLDPSLALGRGLDYAGSRPWADGDNRRDIDWRVSARCGRLHVREYDSLKGMPLAILVDGSASMYAGIGPAHKAGVATAIAGALGVAALRRHSSVILHGIGSDLHGRLTRSRGHLLADLALFMQHAGTKLGSHGLAAALNAMGSRLGQRHLVILISDCDGQNVVEAIHQLHQGHDCIVIRPLDPAELAPPRIGWHASQQPEDGGHRQGFGLHVADWQQTLNRLQGLGIDQIALPIDRDWVPALRHFLRQREHRR